MAAEAVEVDAVRATPFKGSAGTSGDGNGGLAPACLRVVFGVFVEVTDATELLLGLSGFGALGTAFSPEASRARPAVAVLRAETADTFDAVELVRCRGARAPGAGEFGVDVGYRERDGAVNSDLAVLKVVEASLRADMLDSGRPPAPFGEGPGTARLACPFRTVEVVDLTEATEGAIDFGRPGDPRASAVLSPGRGIPGVVGVPDGLVGAYDVRAPSSNAPVALGGGSWIEGCAGCEAMDWSRDDRMGFSLAAGAPRDVEDGAGGGALGPLPL